MFPTIDMSTELAPLLFGMNAALVASSVAIFAAAVTPRLREWLHTRERPRPRLVPRQPALASQAR